MCNKIVIYGELTTLNPYVNSQRINRYAGAKLKKDETHKCAIYIQKAMRKGVLFDFPCQLKFTWYCKNKRQDPDNIAFAKKFILDGMQEAGLIPNDNWATMSCGFVDEFRIDKDNPRVEIEVIENVQT